MNTASFQFTTSQGGRPWYHEISGYPMYFQFTTSQGGRRGIAYLLYLRAFIFQFTTSQGGRLRELSPPCRKVYLSIHDLTRRSTFLRRSYLRYEYLSIHDLTRRSTMKAAPQIVSGITFNSRPHKEVDFRRRHSRLSVYLFQFTTSQGGRLEKERRLVDAERAFNSRPHKEVDMDCWPA